MSPAETLQILTRVLGVALFGFGSWMWVKYDDGRPTLVMFVGLVMLVGSTF